MRKILFRGKRKDNGEWVYGYGVYGTDQNDGPSACYILQKYSTDIVYSETVGQ
jgi:hypothetical protein